jgi:hypothetical protein
MVEGFSMHGQGAHRDSCDQHVAAGSTSVFGQTENGKRSGRVNYILMITCLTCANQLEIRLDFELALAKSWHFNLLVLHSTTMFGVSAMILAAEL